MDEFLELINWVDLFILLALVGAALVGFGIGFYRIAGIGVSLVAGFIAAACFSSQVAQTEFFAPVQERLGVAGSETAAYALILAGSLVIGLGVVLAFRTFFGQTLKLFDSLVGGVVAFAVGLFAIGLVLIGVGRLEDHPLQNDILASLLGPPIAEGARVASKLFPDDFERQIRASFEQQISERVAQEAGFNEGSTDAVDPNSSEASNIVGAAYDERE